MLEESRGMTQVPNAQNAGQAQLTEAQAENHGGQSHHGCMGLSLSQDHSSTLDDSSTLNEIESGRR